MSAANCVSVVLLGAEVAWRSADVQVTGGEKGERSAGGSGDQFDVGEARRVSGERLTGRVESVNFGPYGRA
jgi:hypothetical protein